MSNLYRLMDAQMGSLKPFVGRTLPCIVFCAASLPKSRGKPRVDNRPVLCGIISINRNGLRWRDAPRDYGPAKTLYTRWKPWSDTGVFARIRVSGVCVPLRFAVSDLRVNGDFSSEVSEGFGHGGLRGWFCGAVRDCGGSTAQPALA